MKDEYCPTCGEEMKLTKVLDRRTAIMKCNHCKKTLKYSYNEDTFPKNLKSFNWGAFLIPNFWGFGNGYSIVSFILLVLWGLGSFCSSLHILLLGYWGLGTFFAFYWGFRGNKLSWIHGDWDSADRFESAQRNWTIAVIVYFLIFLICLVIGLFSCLPKA